MLKQADRGRSYPVKILDTTFYLRSLPLRERAGCLEAIADVTDGPGSFDRILDCIVPFIESIEGYDEPVRTTLGNLEYASDLQTIMEAIVKEPNPPSRFWRFWRWLTQ